MNIFETLIESAEMISNELQDLNKNLLLLCDAINNAVKSQQDTAADGNK